MTIVREGQRIACPAGQRVPVRLGDAIEIGDQHRHDRRIRVRPGLIVSTGSATAFRVFGVH